MDLKTILVAVLKNWKTTSAAVGMIIVAIGPALRAILDGDPSTLPNYKVLVPELIAAVALLFARDADKSSQDSGVR